MSRVEVTRPPITTRATGADTNAPPPASPVAIGTSAAMVPTAVIRMGRRRWREPSTMASPSSMPLLRFWLIRSISTMALVMTMPMSISMPIRAAAPTGVPVSHSRPSEPVAANGTEMSSMSGCIRLLNVATMIR